jgi:hypothetical protein
VLEETIGKKGKDCQSRVDGLNIERPKGIIDAGFFRKKGVMQTVKNFDELYKIG